MTNKIYFSVVVPCFNHGNALRVTLPKILSALTSQGKTWEVIVVVDGSSDNSLSVAQEFASHDERVSVLHEHHRRGKGGAVRDGILMARGEYRAFIDADMAIDPAELPRFFSELEQGHDAVVIGRRLRYDTTWIRTLSSWIYRFVNLTLFSLPYADTQAGLKVFRKKTALSLFNALQTHGYAFDIDLLTQAHIQRLSIGVLDTRQGRSEHSNMDLRAALCMVRDTFKTYHRYIAAHMTDKHLWRWASIRHFAIWPLSWVGLIVAQSVLVIMSFRPRLGQALSTEG